MLALADTKGRFLFEIAEHIIPQGYCTALELELWCMHFDDKKERQDRAIEEAKRR